MATSERAAARAPLQAYVLHHYDWSESSVILDLFTRSQGRIAAVAKGAKRPHSQLRAVLLPFQRLAVQTGQRRSDTAEVHLLRSADWAGGPAMPSGAALMTGLYLNELLMKGLARHDPHPVLFDAYEQTLPWLAAAQADDVSIQASLRAFELVLLRHTGVLPELAVVTQNQAPVRSDAAYHLEAQGGVVPSRGTDDAIAGAVLLSMEAALTRGDLHALREACASARTALKSQVRALLHYHLATAAMRTRQLMLEVQRLTESTREAPLRP